MTLLPWAEAPLLERYREYLRVVAVLSPRLRGKVDASDVVQMTLLQAYEKRHQFRGDTDAEFLGWLCVILERQLLQQARKFARHRRDVARECPLPAAGSGVGREGLKADDSTPSYRAVRGEQLLALAGAMAALPEGQRRAIDLHHLRKHSLADTAAEMGVSPEAVAGLLYRGLRTLRGGLGLQTGS